MNIRPNYIEILIVDDELEYRDVIGMILEDHGYKTSTASSAEEAIRVLATKQFHIVLTDLKMGQLDGIDLLKHVKENHSEIEVILITGNGTIENAVDAMKIGAATYIVKTQRSEQLILEIDKVKEKILEKEFKNNLLRTKEAGAYKESKNQTFAFVTESKSEKFKQVLWMAEKAAKSDANILILGESGVGKEMIASFIHAHSNRSEKPFIPVNCSSMAENLLESELFGHEKGAFTGALNARTGMFEASSGGTLFLDEIGDISHSTQVKLLRSLESRMIQKIGSNKLVEVDFRLICATNKSLIKEVEQKNFREDFYYRINTITIEVPPLRERKEDLNMFIDYFISNFSEKMNKSIEGIDAEVRNYLWSHKYDGNIRELKNIIERLVVLSENGAISARHLPKSVSESVTETDLDPEQGSSTVGLGSINDIKSLKDVRKELEAEYIRQAIVLCKYNISEAARKLNLSRRQLYNKMNEYNIEV